MAGPRRSVWLRRDAAFKSYACQSERGEAQPLLPLAER